MSLLFDFATKNLHLATIFYHLVAKWRLNNFFNFEPCVGQMISTYRLICVKGEGWGWEQELITSTNVRKFAVIACIMKVNWWELGLGC